MYYFCKGIYHIEYKAGDNQLSFEETGFLYLYGAKRTDKF